MCRLAQTLGVTGEHFHMPRFSERLGFKELPTLLQMEGVSETLKHSIWNYTIDLFEHDGGWFQGSRAIAQFFRKSPVDELPVYDIPCREWTKEYYYSLAWFEVYDFVEFISTRYANIFPHRRVHQAKDLQAVFNFIFETEHAGYRFIAGSLVPISSSTETAEVSSAIEITSRTGLNGANEHLKTALALFGKRPDPDYRNCIKEAISAVESIAVQIGASKAQGLSGALADLDAKVPIHPALRAAFVKLYGYTSNESGIRHAILDSPNIGFDEAKYMIVACSAFVNFIAAKAAKNSSAQ